MDSVDLKLGFELQVDGEGERRAVSFSIKNLDDPVFPGLGVVFVADELVDKIKNSPTGTIIYAS